MTQDVHAIESIQLDEEPAIGFDSLPQELVDHIVSFLFPSVRKQGSLLSVNWPIHFAALPHIYKRPHISSRNLAKFSETISSRQCTHYCDLVQLLNLLNVVHGARVSQLSRVLRRCSRTLQEFYAPQVGFTQSAFRAIGLLPKLKILDLSTHCEKVELSFFLRAIEKAESLEVIRFPKFSKNSHWALGALSVQ